MSVQLPEAFLDHMRDLLGDEYEAFLESENSCGFRGLRVNTSKVEAEKFEEISPFPLKPIPWIPNGYYLEADAPASRHPYYAAGLYYLQEPSAMTPASCLPVQEGDRILDLCAAPGGKATQLAARLGGTGLLLANDISNSRAKGLLKNLELFGQGNILVTSEGPERLASYFPEFFDKILVDAPCSGEGMFRRDPSMVKDWLEHGPDWYAPLQREIVMQAARMLKPGGLLLYSTCTFSPRENEGTVADLLEREPSFRVCPLPEYSGFAFAKRSCSSLSLASASILTGWRERGISWRFLKRMRRPPEGMRAGKRPGKGNRLFPARNGSGLQKLWEFGFPRRACACMTKSFTVCQSLCGIIPSGAFASCGQASFWEMWRNRGLPPVSLLP